MGRDEQNELSIFNLFDIRIYSFSLSHSLSFDAIIVFVPLHNKRCCRNDELIKYAWILTRVCEV